MSGSPRMVFPEDASSVMKFVVDDFIEQAGRPRVLWWHNLKQTFKINGEKMVRCPECLRVEPLARDWDYQRCRCGGYFYDYR